MSASKHTPWKLIWHGTETYPFPLSIDSADGQTWIARGGTVSSKAHAELMAAAPTLMEQRDLYRAILLDAYEWFAEHIGHDGAPDGGDPGWVGSVRDAIGGEQSSYGPDFDDIFQGVLKRRAAKRAEHDALVTALELFVSAVSTNGEFHALSHELEVGRAALDAAQ